MVVVIGTGLAAGLVLGAQGVRGAEADALECLVEVAPQAGGDLVDEQALAARIAAEEGLFLLFGTSAIPEQVRIGGWQQANMPVEK